MANKAIPSMQLKRVSSTPEGTFGVLMFCEGAICIPFAVTLERAWQENERRISCIPISVYACKKVKSHKFNMLTYEVVGVPNRSNILFHRGNLIKDSEGCILVAESFDIINGKYGIAKSTEGFNDFMKKLDGAREFQLTITEC